MDWSGEPATDLFANWPVVEKYLTNKSMVIVRKVYLQKQELADTARPRAPRGAAGVDGRDGEWTPIPVRLSESPGADCAESVKTVPV
jgi:hypothetical protein